MQHLASALIDLAKTLVDDDHEDDNGWIDPAVWLTFLNWELQELYWRLARVSVIKPALVEESFMGTSVALNTIAVHSVGRDMGNYVQPLVNNQSRVGEGAIWVPTTPAVGTATEWYATRDGVGLTIELWPVPSGDQTYKVRYAAPLAYLAAVTEQTPHLPPGVEQRIVYGMARRALTKESGRSGAIEQGIVLADAFIGHLASEQLKGDGHRVINTRKHTLRQRIPGLIFID